MLLLTTLLWLFSLLHLKLRGRVETTPSDWRPPCLACWMTNAWASCFVFSENARKYLVFHHRGQFPWKSRIQNVYLVCYNIYDNNDKNDTNNNIIHGEVMSLVLVVWPVNMNRWDAVLWGASSWRTLRFAGWRAERRVSSQLPTTIGSRWGGMEGGTNAPPFLVLIMSRLAVLIFSCLGGKKWAKTKAPFCSSLSLCLFWIFLFDNVQSPERRLCREPIWTALYTVDLFWYWCLFYATVRLQRTRCYYWCSV